MADAPQRPEERRTEQALLLADEGGHRGQVVGVESVSEAEDEAEREEAAPADARGLPSWREMGVPVTAVRMELGRRIRIVFVPGVVAGRAENGPETLAEEAQPEDEDDAPRDQTQDGEEALGADVVRGEQRDEAESEH